MLILGILYSANLFRILRPNIVYNNNFYRYTYYTYVIIIIGGIIIIPISMEVLSIYSLSYFEK